LLCHDSAAGEVDEMKTALIVLVILAMCGIACGFADSGDTALTIPYVVKAGVFGTITAIFLFYRGNDEFGLAPIAALIGGVLFLPPAAVLVNLLVGNGKGVTFFRVINAVEDGAILAGVAVAVVLGENALAALIPAIIYAGLFVLDLFPFSIESKAASRDTPTPAAESRHGENSIFRLISLTFQDVQRTAPGALRTATPELVVHIRL
jgi:hypothetical protein